MSNDKSSLNSIYNELLGRDVGTEGLNYWSGKLSEGASLDDIRWGIKQSPEYKRIAESAGGAGNYKDQLNRAYKELLGRDVGEEGLSYWSNELSNGSTMNDVRWAIRQSPEYQDRKFYDHPNPPQSEPASIPAGQTAAGLLDSMLAKDSPLMKRAAMQGKQMANSRGLLNSSMAAGAAQGAMIDRAAPIAIQDANTYSAIARMNAGHRFDMEKMASDFGFRSQLATQEAENALSKLYASSNANAWGVMANNITDLVGQASAQIERIQMNPDINEEDKKALIDQVLENRNQDINFQQVLYQNLAADLASTGLFPDGTGTVSLTNQVVSEYRRLGRTPDQAGVQYWKEAIESGNATIDDLKYALQS